MKNLEYDDGTPSRTWVADDYDPIKLTEEQKKLVRSRDYYRNQMISILLAEKKPQHCTYTGSLSEQDCNTALGLIEEELGLDDE